MKNTFVKTLERDSTLVMQSLFARAMNEDINALLGAKSPFRPMILHYATEDNIQIWENEAMLGWISNRLLEKNQQGTTFIESVVRDHGPILESVKEFWQLGPVQDVEAFAKYLVLIRKAMLGVLMCYYTGIDDRTPKDVQDIVVAMRATDEVFARGSEYVKASLLLIGFDEETAHLVLPHEVVLPINREMLGERVAKGVVLIDGKDVFLMTLEEFASSHPEYVLSDLSADPTEVHEVTGQVASRGTARGRVRIVKNQRQAREVIEGDIIVSPMTTPDFIDAMKRSHAFVTDEGGIICHAAVVARELKKPCVIGTKIATKVFKDDDMVEVDANTGVVRKI